MELRLVARILHQSFKFRYDVLVLKNKIGITLVRTRRIDLIGTLRTD